MATAIRKALRDMFASGKGKKSVMQRMLNPTDKAAGTRVYPPQGSRLEQQIGLRIDVGEAVQGKDGFVRLKLQVNKGAEDATLKKLANKDSHKVYSVVDIDTKQEVTEENFMGLLQEFEEQISV